MSYVVSLTDDRLLEARFSWDGCGNFNSFHEIMVDVVGKFVYIFPAFPSLVGRLWSVIASVAQW